MYNSYIVERGIVTLMLHYLVLAGREERDITSPLLTEQYPDVKGSRSRVEKHDSKYRSKEAGRLEMGKYTKKRSALLVPSPPQETSAI